MLLPAVLAAVDPVAAALFAAAGRVVWNTRAVPRVRAVQVVRERRVLPGGHQPAIEAGGQVNQQRMPGGMGASQSPTSK